MTQKRPYDSRRIVFEYNSSHNWSSVIGDSGTMGSSIVQNVHNNLLIDGLEVTVNDTDSDGLDHVIDRNTIQPKRVSNANGKPSV